MTPAQEKALLANVLELRGRMRHVEGILEGLQAQGRERIETLKHLRITIDHVLRLVRQKEVLLESVGRMVLDGKPDILDEYLRRQFGDMRPT